MSVFYLLWKRALPVTQGGRRTCWDWLQWGRLLFLLDYLSSGRAYSLVRPSSSRRVKLLPHHCMPSGLGNRLTVVLWSALSSDTFYPQLTKFLPSLRGILKFLMDVLPAFFNFNKAMYSLGLFSAIIEQFRQNFVIKLKRNYQSLTDSWPIQFQLEWLHLYKTRKAEGQVIRIGKGMLI